MQATIPILTGTSAQTDDSSEIRLEVRALHLWRGERHLLRGVAFTVNAGELLQITGPNGAGKTSLLRCVCGLLPVESGEVVWCGEPLRTSRESFNRDLAYLAHANALKTELTALENLRFAVGLQRSLGTADARQMLEKLEIPACADLPVRLLSAGQRRRVALARILLTGARLWVLDEPITNLDAAGITLIEQCISEHLRGGGTVLTAAHQLLLQERPGVRTLELH